MKKRYLKRPDIQEAVNIAADQAGWKTKFRLSSKKPSITAFL